MKLFEFSGTEIDWVAADNEAQAREALRIHYGITDDDIDGSYEEITEIDPSGLVLDTDEVDAETEETITIRAVEVMMKMTRPGLVASTYQ